MKVDPCNYTLFLSNLDKKNQPICNTHHLLTDVFFENKSYANCEDLFKNAYEKIIIENGFNSGCVNNDVLINILEIYNPNSYVDVNNLYHNYKYKSVKPKTLYPYYEPRELQLVTIDKSINNIQDILDMIHDFPLKPHIKYNIDLQLFHSIKEPLYKLNQMIGLKELKVSVLDQLIYFIQKLHINTNHTSDFMHTVLYGPPGTGKTEIAQILGDIFCKLDILKKKNFVKVTRSDLIAGYLGQTAIKTKDVIKKAIGGVLFIDEVYALGNSEKRDSFSKECIDTLCESLSNYKNELMVIIAGYEKDINECFFSYNEGLESRFAWRLNIDKYNGEELCEIFYKKITDIGWNYVGIKEELKKWFIDNVENFPYYGRDVEMLLSKVKIAHSRRIFGKSDDLKKNINFEDVKIGYEKFQTNNGNEKKNESNKFKKHLLDTLYC
jgi:SpoVK/Ycf46/Vps4 family AAA+-type ATPase